MPDSSTPPLPSAFPPAIEARDMGSAERRLRHRAELRAAILDAALEIVATEGLGGLSIRALADRIEYSAATIYLYFDSKEALVHEVAHEGFRRLLEAVRTATAATGPSASSAAALHAAVRAYVRFAVEHAAYFRAMFEPAASGAVTGSRVTDASPALGGGPGHDDCCYRGLLEQVVRATGRDLPAGVSQAAAVAALATVHGLVSLYLSGTIDDLAHDPAELTALVERCIASLGGQAENGKPAR